VVFERKVGVQRGRQLGVESTCYLRTKTDVTVGFQMSMVNRLPQYSRNTSPTNTLISPIHVSSMEKQGVDGVGESVCRCEEWVKPEEPTMGRDIGRGSNGGIRIAQQLSGSPSGANL